MAFDLVLDVRYKNRNVAFGPGGSQPLAGEYNIADINSDKIPGGLNQIGGKLPGYRVEIDTKNARGKIIDKLRLKENAAMMDKIRFLLANDNIPQRIGEKWKRDDAMDEGEWDLSGDAPPQNLATWLWHLRKLVDAGRLHVVKGTMPSEDVIRAMGLIWTGDAFGREGKDDKPVNILEPVGAA